MKCLQCNKPIQSEPNHLGMHPQCFLSVFALSTLEIFEDFSRKNSRTDKSETVSQSKNSPYLTSFFAGNYRKYEARLAEDRYILKFQEAQFPELVAVEYVCNKIALAFSIRVPQPFAILKINQECSFVVKNFLSPPTRPSNLVHLYHYLDKAPQKYAVEEIYAAIVRETNSIRDGEQFLTTILFDALIGNHDRHGRNFGIIETSSKKRLAPIYDNVSALGLESGELLQASWSPKGKVYTKSNSEPIMKDYVMEFERMGQQRVLKKFGTALKKTKIEQIVSESPLLSQNMKKALIRLISTRREEFWHATGKN